MQTVPQFPAPDQTPWEAAVHAIADRALLALGPDSESRIERAVQIIFAGGVAITGEHSAVVSSQSQPYRGWAVNGACPCPDFTLAPAQLCKHRLAAHMYRRALELAEPPMPRVLPPTGDEDIHGPSPLGIPPQYVTHLHGKAFVQFAGLLAMAHARGLTSLKAHFISVTSELALAEAEAVFQDGRTYGECADATPGNVGPTIRAHFPRMALTRAKARTLRDALNIGMCSVEEVE